MDQKSFVKAKNKGVFNFYKIYYFPELEKTTFHLFYNYQK